MRADGKRVKGLSPIVSAIPFIMPHRYDAQNAITEYIDMERLREYIREKRKDGVHISHMNVILAAYYRAVQQHPEVNRFIMNCHIYQRNHFCVSFVILKKRADGTPDETTIKVFFDESDDIFSINRKVEEAIAQNQDANHNNATDRFAAFMLSVPVLPHIVMGLVRGMDRLGLLPRKIIDLSPFHTSMFITNLASIQTSYIHHHCYDFGTTGIFLCMGKPVADYLGGDHQKKLMPLAVVMDERICTGSEYAQFWFTLRRYLRNPRLLEGIAPLLTETEDQDED